MSEDASTPDLSADDDWKEQVRRENEALDNGPDQTDDDHPGDERDMPPADFPALVHQLSVQALMGLGQIPLPGQPKPEVQLPIARYFIDMLGVLEKKTQGNLNPDEAMFLDETLHQLRMAFVQVTKGEDR